MPPPTIRKFSGDKSPRVRGTSTALDEAATAGAVEESGLTMEPGALLGRYSPTTGEVEQLVVEGAGAELGDGVIRFLADAQRALGLGQFADTTSAAFREVITDPTGNGAVVFNVNPSLINPRLPTSGGNYVVLTGPASGSGIITFPAAFDTAAVLLSAQTLYNKTLESPALTGALITQTQNANSTTIFEVKNTNTGGSSYSVFRLTNGSSTIDMLASHAGTIAQFGAGGSIVQFQMVFDTYVWYNIAVTQLARLSATGLRIGSTASAATSPLMVDGAIATNVFGTTTDLTVTSAHSTIICNKAGSTCTLTLPDASTCVGRKYRIVNWQAQTVVSSATTSNRGVAPRGSGVMGTPILPATIGAWCDIEAISTGWWTTAGS